MLLPHDDVYFDDYSATMYLPGRTSKYAHGKHGLFLVCFWAVSLIFLLLLPPSLLLLPRQPIEGRLKVCASRLVFDPKDYSYPIYCVSCIHLLRARLRARARARRTKHVVVAVVVMVVFVFKKRQRVCVCVCVLRVTSPAHLWETANAAASFHTRTLPTTSHGGIQHSAMQV